MKEDMSAWKKFRELKNETTYFDLHDSLKLYAVKKGLKLLSQKRVNMLLKKGLKLLSSKRVILAVQKEEEYGHQHSPGSTGF